MRNDEPRRQCHSVENLAGRPKGCELLPGQTQCDDARTLRAASDPSSGGLRALSKVTAPVTDSPPHNVLTLFR